MLSSPSLHVAVVGLEFGAEFVPIYRDHPAVARLSVADLNPSLSERVGRFHDVDRISSSLDDVLADQEVDAVHIVTGLHAHADQVVAALGAGKHVACTVPMALSFEEIDRILEAQQAAQKNYMMMETAVFTREYFFARDLFLSGAMGDIAYARGTHFQDMTDWPDYWEGLPPMFYATHAVSPILSLLRARAIRTRSIGGGRLHPANRGSYGNPFPVESALVELDGHPAAVELTRSLSQVARAYTESFAIYGERQSFEWPQLEGQGEDPILYEMGERGGGRGRKITATRVTAPDRADMLPSEIRRYTTRSVYDNGGSEHLSFTQGGGHGGSHPHLVHEFVSSIVDGRPASVDQTVAANWTATGIAAHMSAMRGGAPVDIPSFG